VILAWSGIGLGLALAQEGVGDGHGLALAPQDGDPRAPLVVQQASASRAGDAYFSALAEYARPDDATLRELVALNLSAGVAPLDRLRLDLQAPIFGWASGSGQSMVPTVGDVRLTSMVALVRPARSSVGLGVAAHLDAPTGAEARQLGQPGWAGGGRLALSFGSDAVTFSTNAGLHLRAPRSTAAPGDVLLGSMALSVGFGERMGLVLEGVSTVAPARLAGDDTAHLGLEALGAFRISSPRGPFVTLGAASGIVPDMGAPLYRTMLGFGVARRRGHGPPDIDLIYGLRSTDLCPVEVETTNGWRDDDGCPDRLGTLSVDVRFEGESLPAMAEIVGPTLTREQRIGPQGLSLDVMPGTKWAVRATEACLTGEAQAIAAEEGATLVVELEAVHDAQIEVEVLDSAGVPVPGAEVSWRSETPGCAPRTPVEVSPEGRVTQPIASGLHTLVVRAPRFDVHDQIVSVLKGPNDMLTVILEPSRIYVEGNEIRVLDKIRFVASRSSLLDDSLSILDEVAALVAANPELGRIEVGGHTDSRGSEDLNRRLSYARAEAVKGYLIGRGVPAERIEARGYGESEPVESNRVESGRDANRRVTFRLLDLELEAG